MGFPSPAKDFIEQRLDLNALLVARPGTTLKVDTVSGFALVDRSLMPQTGDTVAFELFGINQFGRVYPACIITEDGEAVEGDALEEVRVIGVVTTEVTCLYDRYRPVI